MQPNGRDPFAEKFFTPARFAGLLALLVFAAFPQVLLGLETFVVRDFGFFAYPLAHFQRECFQHGDLPFWNPYNNCGVPFLAQFNTMALYPPSLFYLLLPLEWALGVFALLHLWWAGLGMYFLARRWTGNNFAAAFAGLVFAFNGWTINLLIWPSHIATFSWMPWVILAAQLAWREGMERIIFAAFVGALQMLAGGPETILLTWLIAAVLWLQELVFRGGDAAPPRIVMLWRFPLVVALVIALSAAQLFPFLDLIAHSQRAAGFADLRWSMPGSGAANFLVPMAFGTTAPGGGFFQPGQFMTGSYYLGVGALWLALGAVVCLRERRVWLLAGIAAAGILFALGEHTPVLPALRKLVPQLSLVTYPIKYVTVVIFAAPLLAAIAIANLEKVRRRLPPLGAILLLLLLAVVGWTQFAPAAPGINPHLALASGVSRAAFLLLTGILLLALTRQGSSSLLRFAPLLLMLVAWTDVYTHEPPQNPTAPPWIYQPNLTREKLALNPQPELGGSRAMVSPLAAHQFMTYAASDVKNNFVTKRLGYCGDCNVLDAVPKVDGFFSLSPRECDEVQSLFYTTTNASYPGLEAFMGVSQITAPDALYRWQARTNFLPLVTAGQQPVFADDQSALARMARGDFDGSKVVFLPPGEKASVSATNFTPAKILNSKFDTRTVDIEAETAAPSLVVIAQTYYHHWQAEVDGVDVPLLRANVAFQAVQIPAGKHQIHLAYNDRAFQIGAAIALCTVFNCLFGLGLMTIRRHARPKPVIEGGDSLF